MQLREPGQSGQPQGQGIYWFNYNGHHEYIESAYVREKSFVCDGNSRIAFIRNDHLDVHSCNYSDETVGWYGPEFLEDFDIIVLNKGAHHQEKAHREYFVETETLATCLAEHIRPKNKIIFRTSPPGHYNCGDFQSPDMSTLLSQPPPLGNPPEDVESSPKYIDFGCCTNDTLTT